VIGPGIGGFTVSVVVDGDGQVGICCGDEMAVHCGDAMDCDALFMIQLIAGTDLWGGID
jgi:hypothetical protein